ncbi:RNA polymerase sigma-70 factor [Pedobacter mendelii]|uniref:RNA polymerase sigma-70 factor n=1 Tax=Pedobacter mendelii TaxID=1908240 RepID=A0ABQ2BH39_9SPHI|nr:RNA polymerase sigma-70 factor [Pedobacter mendelii]GGI24342.1 RNA polymerase sigma-70 factor [Pedobacter mendelii]
MTITKLTDLELFHKILLDDVNAFNELFERHWAKVYAVAFRYVKDRELALEISHDIFVNIWTKRKQLNIDSFQNYVVTAASYHGIRKSRVLKAIPISYVANYFENEKMLPAALNFQNANLGEQKIREEEFNTNISALLESLPNRCREIYIMSRKDNLSIKEIATLLNISKRTVENQLTIALKHLRAALKYYSLLLILFDSYRSL